MRKVYTIHSSWNKPTFSAQERSAIMRNIDEVIAHHNEQANALQVIQKFEQYIPHGTPEDFVLRKTRGQDVVTVHGHSPRDHNGNTMWTIEQGNTHDTAAAGHHYTGNWHFDQEEELEGRTTSIVFSAILWHPSTSSLGTEVHEGNAFESSATEPKMFFTGEPTPHGSIESRHLKNGEIFPASYMYHRAPANLSQQHHFYTTTRYTAQVTFQFATPRCIIRKKGSGKTATMLHEAAHGSSSVLYFTVAFK